MLTTGLEQCELASYCGENKKSTGVVRAGESINSVVATYARPQQAHSVKPTVTPGVMVG